MDNAGFTLLGAAIYATVEWMLKFFMNRRKAMKLDAETKNQDADTALKLDAILVAWEERREILDSSTKELSEVLREILDEKRKKSRMSKTKMSDLRESACSLHADKFSRFLSNCVNDVAFDSREESAYAKLVNSIIPAIKMSVALLELVNTEEMLDCGVKRKRSKLLVDEDSNEFVFEIVKRKLGGRNKLLAKVNAYHDRMKIFYRDDFEMRIRSTPKPDEGKASPN